MKPIKFEIEGFEAIQTKCTSDGEFDYKPLNWDGKHVIIILVEPMDEEHSE